MCIQERQTQFLEQQIDRINTQIKLSSFLMYCIRNKPSAEFSIEIAEKYLTKIKPNIFLLPFKFLLTQNNGKAISKQHLNILLPERLSSVLWIWVRNGQAAEAEHYMNKLSPDELQKFLSDCVENNKEFVEKHMNKLSPDELQKFLSDCVINNKQKFAKKYMETLTPDILHKVLLETITVSYGKESKERIEAFSTHYMEKLSSEHVRQLLLECAIRHKESFARRHVERLTTRDLKILSQACENAGLFAFKDYIAPILSGIPIVKRL